MPTRHPRGPARLDGTRDRGAAAVEFALVSVVLFPVLFGTIGFGWTFWELNAAQNTVREAAREASLGVQDSFGRTVTCLAQGNANDGARVTAVAVTFWSDAAATQPLTAAAPGGYVRVTLTYQSRVAGVLPSPLTDAGGRFTVTATNRVEQLSGNDLLTYTADLTSQTC